MIALLVTIILFLLAAIGLLYWRVEFLTDVAEDYVTDEHAKCMAAVMQFIGDEYAAKILETAAHDWDSAEESHRLKVLARMRYQSGGKSVPALWMEDRAAMLRGAKDVAAHD